MSNGWKLELLRWGSGEVCLTYWDADHGDDQVFVLHPDGTVFRASYDGDGDEPTLEPVNLVQELLGLLAKLEQAEEDDFPEEA